jgi:hypothetical protein
MIPRLLTLTHQLGKGSQKWDQISTELFLAEINPFQPFWDLNKATILWPVSTMPLAILILPLWSKIWPVSTMACINYGLYQLHICPRLYKSVPGSDLKSGLYQPCSYHQRLVCINQLLVLFTRLSSISTVLLFQPWSGLYQPPSSFIKHSMTHTS